MNFKLLLCVKFFLFCLVIKATEYDLTIVGQFKFAESLPRLSIGIIDCLKNDLKINFIPTFGYFDFYDAPKDVVNIVKNNIKNNNRKPGKVALFTDMLWHLGCSPYKKVPNNSKIKIAYSMLESSSIPTQWVQILNSKFDAVVVPDIYYKNIYYYSGVKIPIYVIPCGMYIEDLLSVPIKEKKLESESFVFGVSAAFTKIKNYETLILAFAKEFKNNSKVILKLHGRAGSEFEKIKQLIAKLKLKNVYLIRKSFTREEYKNFLMSLDCYVLLSKGEGFSLTPREALALGIPCIITNNSAHKTICDTGLVYAVDANIKEPAYYKCFNKHIGYYFNCRLKDVQEAFKAVYLNYQEYLTKAAQGRIWVEQYLYKNLKSQYLTLVKPERVILSAENKINGRVLFTNSRKLYLKYLDII